MSPLSPYADRPSFPQVLTFPAKNTDGKLRILHIVFSSGLAGSERYCVDLANQQSGMGHEVHVAGPRNARIVANLAPGVFYHPVGPLLRKVHLARLVARIGIDVCHAHLSRACKVLGRLRTRALKVATLHVGYKVHQHARLDGLICVNQVQTQALAGYGGRSRVVSNWLPSEATKRKIDLRRELGLPDGAFVVGAVGRLHPSKGCDLLIRAFRDVAPADAALVLVGDGPHRKALEALRGDDDRIHFLGFREDVAAVMENFDLFVSPSREESFGLAILEAMAAGLPVIATATDGPGEYLRQQPATLVEPGSAGALGQAIARQIYRPDPAPRYDLRPFDPAVNVREIVDFYAELGAGRQEPETREASTSILRHASTA